MEKPPTQGVGVQGIASAKQGLSTPIQMNWKYIARLPAFQMFAAEKSGQAPSEVDTWVGTYLADKVATQGEQSVYDEYCQWHSAKGYWKNETPFGELIGG